MNDPMVSPELAFWEPAILHERGGWTNLSFFDLEPHIRSKPELLSYR